MAQPMAATDFGHEVVSSIFCFNIFVAVDQLSVQFKFTTKALRHKGWRRDQWWLAFAVVAVVPRAACLSFGQGGLRRSLLGQTSLPHRDRLVLAHGWSGKLEGLFATATRQYGRLPAAKPSRSLCGPGRGCEKYIGCGRGPRRVF